MTVQITIDPTHRHGHIDRLRERHALASDGSISVSTAPFPPDQMPYFSLRAEAPKTEAILRKTTQDLQEGKPDFSTMEPELQNAVKEQAQHTAEIYQTGKISLLLLQPAFPWE